MDGFPGRWWIAAGHAIELHVGRPVRDHEDVDVLVLRDDQEAVRRHLRGWDLRIAHGGRLEPWPEGARIGLPRTSLWVRSDPDHPWQLQLLLDECYGGTWWFRRDPRIRLPVEELGLHSPEGIPYVRPEVTLLFKAREPRERDETDFEALLPTLDERARARLADWLPPDHPWRNRI
jgi:hypothetical protein